MEHDPGAYAEHSLLQIGMNQDGKASNQGNKFPVDIEELMDLKIQS